MSDQEPIPQNQEAEYLENAATAAREAEDSAITALGQELVEHEVERVHAASIGDEAERYTEATQASAWAEALDNPDLPSVPHPGRSAITYRMSKALDGEERSELLDRYVEDPSAASLPQDLNSGKD